MNSYCPLFTGRWVHDRAAIAASVLLAIALAGCGTRPVARTEGHLKTDLSTTSGPTKSTATAGSSIPEPVRQIPLPPPPQPRVDEMKYSVTVKDVPVQELMFAISRDTKVNIDIHAGIEGRVTLNAIDQTLKQILTRVSKQVDMRWEIDGPNIVVRPDTPYLRIYKVDYVNMTRDSTGTIGVQTQVVGPSGVGSTGGGNTGGTGTGQNSSQIRLDAVSKNRFWENLEKNVRDILRETDKLLPEGSSETIVQNRSQGQTSSTRAQSQQTQSSAQRRTNSSTAQNAAAAGPGVTDNQSAQESVSQTLTFREAASVIVNPETGTLVVRATSRQQERVAEFIEQIGGSARRQVLIEATVVEVVLNDNYQSGVDWSALGLQGLGYSIRQNFTGANLTESPFFSVQYRNPNAAAGGDISSTIKLLNSFGNTKVLSSPKIMTLNNQTAVMRVVENTIYFTVQSTVTPGTTTAQAIVSYNTTPNVVPEGFVMNVTPQISDNDIINLNVRPSVTRVTSYVNDPNPDLGRAGVVSRVPQIQTREFETMMRVASGQTAVLGGLMQDSLQTSRDGLPLLARIPVLGDAVSYRNDTGRKSELVVFIRAMVVREASLDADLSDYRKYLPDSQFFKDPSPSVDLMNPKTYQPVPVVVEGEPRKAP
ncbi:MAG: secretin N-terminal domain-containing protein [Betaproteobacteria bacterium]|nr:secretin N-terminal domain-containing protein [Betaproteobacteria bacterium]